MHPILEEMQRANQVHPDMVGFYGRWTRELIDYTTYLENEIARLKAEREAPAKQRGKVA